MKEPQSLASYERWDGIAPGDHQFSTLDNFAYDGENNGHNLFKRAASKLINDWEGDQFVGLLLHGEAGTGKSHAAVALARALHDNGADIAYRFVPELTDHHTAVSYWTAPRVYETVYGISDTVTTTTVEKTESGEQSTSHARYEDRALIVKRDPHSVFPSYYEKGIERNPKTVLVLDDYKPLWRPHVRSAIEAASNFGGAIIMTSNFGNMFELANPGEADLPRASINYSDPEELQAEKATARNAEAEKLRNAFMSRLVGGFMEIPFTGIDLRKQNSFWTDLYDPRDFLDQ